MSCTKLIRSGWLVFWLATLAAGCVADDAGEPARRESCVALRDHVAALQVATVPVPGDRQAVAAELAKHRRNLSDSLGEGFVADCTATRSARYVDCALAAATSGALRACDDRQAP